MIDGSNTGNTPANIIHKGASVVFKGSYADLIWSSNSGSVTHGSARDSTNHLLLSDSNWSASISTPISKRIGFADAHDDYWGGMTLFNDRDQFATGTNGYIDFTAGNLVINARSKSGITRIGGGWNSWLSVKGGDRELAGNTNGQVVIGHPDLLDTTTDSMLVFHPTYSVGDINGGDAVVIQSDGAVTRRAWPSDTRLKENIKISKDSVLAKISQIDVITHDWILKNYGRADIDNYLGFKAQQLETIFPELIRSNSRFEDDELEIVGLSEEDRNTKKVLEHPSFNPILIKAVQELTLLIAEKDANIKSLEDRLKIIETKLGL